MVPFVTCRMDSAATSNENTYGQQMHVVSGIGLKKIRQFQGHMRLKAIPPCDLFAALFTLISYPISMFKNNNDNRSHNYNSNEPGNDDRIGHDNEDENGPDDDDYDDEKG